MSFQDPNRSFLSRFLGFLGLDHLAGWLGMFGGGNAPAMRPHGAFGMLVTAFRLFEQQLLHSLGNFSRFGSQPFDAPESSPYYPFDEPPSQTGPPSPGGSPGGPFTPDLGDLHSPQGSPGAVPGGQFSSGFGDFQSPQGSPGAVPAGQFSSDFGDFQSPQDSPGSTQTSDHPTEWPGTAWKVEGWPEANPHDEELPGDAP